MSFSDPSAIVLLIGALAIVVFLVHGLWFSNKPQTRKLSKNDKKDQEIRSSDQIGKVRIVSTDNKKAKHTFDARKNPSASQATVRPLGIVSSKEDIAHPWKDIYEINIVAPADKPFKGEDIAQVAQEFGFLYGDLNIYYVYEQPELRKDEVFRICSLKDPFSFPEDMTGYTTPAIAIYMGLPAKGKGFAYFKALRMAANILTERLGGVIEDNHHNILTEEMLDSLAEGLTKYDEAK